MMSAATAVGVPEAVAPADTPVLLWELEPWHRNFFRNLGDLLLRREPPPLELTSQPVPLRSNYFIRTGADPIGVLESYGLHIAAVVLIYLVCTLPFFNRPIKLNSPFDNTEIHYYPLSDYLPPMNTAQKAAMKPRHGAPKLAKQEILSVPANPDNTHQTIVTPPKIKLDHDVPLPNIVAWTPIPAAQPIAASARSVSQLKVPSFEPQVVAPAADVSHLKLKAQQLQPEVVAPAADVSQLKRKIELPTLQPSVVEPSLSADQLKLKAGDLNMAQLQPSVAAPKLPVEPQRSTGTGEGAPKAAADTAAKAAGGEAVPSAPNVQGLHPTQGQGQIIALGLNPADVRGPLAIPQGNRSGEFHASPNGKADAAGTPNVTGSGTADQGGGNGKGNGVPAGLVVGNPPPGANTSAVAGAGGAAGSGGGSGTNPNLEAQKRIIAEAMKPSVPSIRERAAPAPPDSLVEDPEASIERRVFGRKRSYSLIMNMPNLTSATGSWIIRFAELNESDDKGPITAPVAISKIDPAYPADVLRDRIEGTVTLYAVIRTDGTVDGIRVLGSLDSRLDANAVLALYGWHFRPGIKNGQPVAVEAVVQIPFRMRSLR
jgi:TonB family protein